MDYRCFYSERLNLAVTGASGFIGSGIIKSDDTFIAIKIEDLPQGVVIIHLSADLSNDKQSFIKNIEMDLGLIDLINHNHKGLIYASGNNVYPFGLNFKIHSNPSFNDYYSASKIVGEQLIEAFLKVPYVLVRIGDVFGVGQRHGNFFKSIENSVRNKSSLKLYGKGMKLRNYIYQPELCSFLVYLSELINRNTYFPNRVNACFPNPISIQDIVLTIQGMTNLDIEHIFIEDDHSNLDVRTMISGPFSDYSFKWPTFEDAIRDYITQIK